MGLILAKEQSKAIKTEGPGWLGSTGQRELAEVGGPSRRRHTGVCRCQEDVEEQDRAEGL